MNVVGFTSSTPACRQFALALFVRLEHASPVGRQAVRHHESGVVRGIFISLARIAQAHDDFGSNVHGGEKQE